MNEKVIAAFREAVEASEPEAVLETFAEDITFNNPVMFRPFEGRETLAYVVPKLLEVWQDLRYVAELHGDGFVGLVFDARASQREVRGVDLLHFDEDEGAPSR